MATASTSWMPAAGRHNVSIGSSLSKALKARKGQPPTQRSRNLPERDFYALRYNHKPASIDPTKPGTLDVNPGKEVTTVRVERPTVNNNEVIVFKGDEKPAKEWECVLIYDEATQTFTLEKLDSLVNLNFDAKAQSRTRPAASPHSASSSSAAQTPRRSPVRTAADELEAQLEDAGAGMSTYPDTDADADGEPDPSFSQPQEEEEGEEREKVQQTTVVVAAQRRSASSAHHHQKTAAPPPPAPAPQQSKARPTPSSKKSAAATAPQSASAKAARASASAAAPASAQSSSSKPRPRPIPPAAAAPTTSTPPTVVVGSARKRAAATMENRDVDVEDFEIRGPIAPVTASARRSSTATATTSGVAHGSSFSLALPTASAGPDPLAHQGLYNGGGGGGGGGGAVPSSGAAADSDDEWDEILLDRSLSHHHQQQGEEPTTMDDEPDDRLVDFLERELLGEDEPMGDGDGDGDEDEEEEMEEVGGHPHSSLGPMSMNQFAGGETAVEDDDDDYSSSEESEED